MAKDINNKIKTLSKTSSKSAPPIMEPVIFGFVILLIFFGGFSLWSYLAPLESAAVASGKVTVASNRKTIQHLEGGIVKKIHVTEGSAVNIGDPLITLDDTQAKARLQILQSQALELTATEARLIAERDNETTVTWPERLQAHKNNPKVKKIIESQENIFNANRKTLAGQLDILNQRIKQSKKQIESLEAQVNSETKQLELIKEELVAVEYLEKKKLIEKPRLLALKREAARLEGNRGEHQGLIASTEQEIGETKQRIITIKDDTLKKTLDVLDQAQSRLADTLEKETAAQDILNRTIIYAPQSGIVVALEVHTLGGVISPGQSIMDIVPSNDQLVIETQISPLDIDIVHNGLLAKVRLTAFKQRHTPILNGKVTRVSPDSFTDKQSGKTFFLARVTINQDELQKHPNLILYPGMPVQVMIVTEKRSALDYMIQPLKDSFEKAFKEN